MRSPDSGSAGRPARRGNCRGSRRSPASRPCASRPAMCGVRITLGSVARRSGAGPRLDRVHVEAGARDGALGQRIVERVLVDDRPARGVDEERGRLHLRRRSPRRSVRGFPECCWRAAIRSRTAPAGAPIGAYSTPSASSRSAGSRLRLA